MFSSYFSIKALIGMMEWSGLSSVSYGYFNFISSRKNNNSSSSSSEITSVRV